MAIDRGWTGDSLNVTYQLAPSLAAQRLIMASNRGPVQHAIDAAKRVTRQCNSGGVSTALASAMSGAGLTWIAHAASQADRLIAQQDGDVVLDDGSRLRLVAAPRDAYDLHYGTFCNPTLWFLQHGLWDRLERRDLDAEIVDAWQNGYLPVNQLFAEAVIDEIDRSHGPGQVMLHDYHLYAAPLFIRNRRPTAFLQQFIHIPWPDPDVWRVLPAPVAQSICQGLLANDSVAFQTPASVENFALSCEAFLPDARVDEAGVSVTRAGNSTRIWANPVSVDIWDVRECLFSPVAEDYRQNLACGPDVQTIVRVDRLDPTKNVAVGFRAFARLLERHPELRGKVRFIALLVPSRAGIAEYRSYRDEVFAEIDAINTRFSDETWTPVTVFHEHNRTQALVAMSMYDVLLVNPVADGMNLVSKEGPVVNDRDGVLVLSETAGSFAELRSGALPVQPNDVDGTARALYEALTLSLGERRERARRLRATVVRHDLARWTERLLEDLRTPARPSGGTHVGGGSQASRAG